MRLRGGLPLVLLLVLLVAVPILEVWLLLQVAGQIGTLPTIAILVAEAALGAWLMRREGRRAWTALTSTFATGRVPSGELTDAALVLVGGVLLLLPGFVTDIVGFLFLLPMTRPAARKLVAFFIARRLSRIGPMAPPGRTSPGDVIRGETVPDAGPEGENRPGPARSRSADGQLAVGGRDQAVFFLDGAAERDQAVEPSSPDRNRVSRSASRSSSSGMERRSRSMSQCVRTAFSSLASGRCPSERSDSAPHRGHSHRAGMSASAEKTMVKWCWREQS